MGDSLCQGKVFVGVDTIEPSAANGTGFAEGRLQGGTVGCPINAPR
jgi:hypothetical protein